MNVAGASGSATIAQPQQKTQSQTLDYDAFLQLLIAEIKSQDPTNPMDAGEYISQLASFSNVEQTVKANAKLDNVISSISLLQADAMIDKRVTSGDGTVTGVVQSLKIIDAGAIAVLDNGEELMLGSGVSVSAP